METTPQNRPLLHQHFVDRFAEPGSRREIPAEPIARLEANLSLSFPQSYRAFLSHYGPIRCAPTLHTLVAHQIALWDIRSFLTESEILDSARIYGHAGMRATLIGFASDPLGNLFCFERATLQTPRDDAPIWFFDHEFTVDTELAPSFDAWLGSYLAIPDLRAQN